MGKKYTVALAELAREHDLKVVYAAPDFSTIRVGSVDINRPGIQLMGYLEHFDASRIQLIGRSETAMMEELDRSNRE